MMFYYTFWPVFQNERLIRYQKRKYYIMKKALMLVLASLFLASFSFTANAQPEVNADTGPVKKDEEKSEESSSESEEKSEE